MSSVLRRYGFTLIELLVVITIIVVLISFLIPALDTAIYQAEMAVCGSNQHNIASTALNYALDHKKQYPYRNGVQTQVNWSARTLANTTSPHLDERKVLRGYFSLNGHLNCPLTGEVDIDGAGGRSVNVAGQASAYGTQVAASIDMWFGWRWVGDQGMRKIGDRFAYTTTGANSQRITEYFDLLGGDFSIVKDGAFSYASHPDKDGVLFNQVFNDADNPFNAQPFLFTMAWWRDINNKRGPVDLNFVYQDGARTSVETIPHRLIRMSA